MKFPSIYFQIIAASFFLGLWVPVVGDESTDLLNKARDLVRQIENPSGTPLSDAQRVDLLDQAIVLMQKAPNHRLKGHRVLAIQEIRAAIAEIQQGDPNHKVAGYLHDAEMELNTAITVAGENSPALNTAVTSPPLSPSSGDSQPVADALPPGVTPEMEQTFLTKYKAAVDKKDPDAMFSLVATDPNMDPKAKKDLKGLIVFGLVMATSNPNRTYSFVPAASAPKSEPARLDGKMYDAYLPAVVAMKISFGKPDHLSSINPVATGDTIIPLGTQDNQLMLIGLKEIPGAVPPSAINKTANFGIEPNLRKIGDKQSEEDENAYVSKTEFLASLQQPAVQVLASGESTYEYYAICRIAPNLCVWAGGDKVERGNYTFRFMATDSSKQELKGAPKWIRLVDVPTDNGQAPVVQGTVFYVPDHYSGPITLDAHYQNDSGEAVNLSQTINWK